MVMQHAYSTIRGLSALFITAVLLAGCFGGEGVEPVDGTVSGLEGQGLELALDDGQRVELSPGTQHFAFKKPLKQGRQYRVSVTSQPVNPGQACEVINENGTVIGGKEGVGVVCEDGHFELRSRSDIMQMHLEWDGPDTVNVLYSSDPDCDWGNYQSCENSGMLPGQSGGSLTLGAVDDGFDPDTGWYFVAQIGNERTNQVGARPAPPAFSPVAHSNPYNQAILPTEARLYVAAERPMIYTGAGAIFDAETGEPAGNSMPIIDGLHARVSGAAPDGKGGWYIGGVFETVGGLPRRNLARIRADGSTDPAWEHEHPFGWEPEEVSVMDLAVGEDVVYVVFKVPYHRHLLRAFRADTGELLRDWLPDIEGQVYAIEADDTHLYVGGTFSSVDGEPRSNLVALPLVGADAENRPDPAWQAGVNLDVDTQCGYSCSVKLVTSIAVQDGVVYVNGTFNTAGQGPDPDAYEDRAFLAAFDAASKGDGSGQLISQWTPPATWSVHRANDMRLVEDTVQIGKVFEAVGVGDGTGKEITDWEWESSINWANRTGARGINVIASSDTEVFVGGTINGPVIDTQKHLIALDRRTGTLIPDWPAYELEDYDAYWDRYVNAPHISELAIAGDTLYAGGRFSAVNGEERWRLAAVDRHTGALDEDWNPGVQLPLWRNDETHHTAVGRIEAMAATDDAVYVAPIVGRNVHYSWVYPQEPPQYLVAIETASQGDGSGAPITGWTPEVDAQVRTLLLDDDVLYAGGDFKWAGQTRRHALAAFNLAGAGAGGQPLVADWHPDISKRSYFADDGIAVGKVYSLDKQGDTLYAAGEYVQAGGVPRENVAAFDAVGVGDGTGTVDADWDPSTHLNDMESWHRGPVKAISAIGDKVYISNWGCCPAYGLGIIDAVGVGDGTGQIEVDAYPKPRRFTRSQATWGNLLYIGNSMEFEDGRVRHDLTVIDTETGELAW